MRYSSGWVEPRASQQHGGSSSSTCMRAHDSDARRSCAEDHPVRPRTIYDMHTGLTLQIANFVFLSRVKHAHGALCFPGRYGASDGIPLNVTSDDAYAVLNSLKETLILSANEGSIRSRGEHCLAPTG